MGNTGFCKEIVDDVSANQQIDKVSMRYTGHPYARDNNTSWEDAKKKDREMWIINIEKMVAMNRPAAKIVQSEVDRILKKDFPQKNCHHLSLLYRFSASREISPPLDST
ncbi:MAG: hypothetical protein Ct9H90mP22_7720 [Gammaproteobacteria bacterium]|nr:MAG: hypothetical protein Ct9H90mP22_7720 [Gammaproteobacteria bacterium]